MGIRVGVNALYLVPRQVGGTEVYCRELVRALGMIRPNDDFVVFCAREAGPVLRAAGWPANVRVRELPVRAAIKPLRLAAEMTLLPVAADRARVDVLHSLGTTSPLAGHATRVVTVHDLIYHHWPGTFPVPARLGLRAVVPIGARRARRVQVSSHAAARDVETTLGIDPGKIDVVYLGLGMREVRAATPEDELRARLALGSDDVVLTVAAALPHKNIERLLEAMARLGAGREAPPRLVMVGHAGLQSDVLRARAERLGLDGRVTLTGWVTDEDLEGLYRFARCFVYPSLHEGFGIPVLEAMGRGVPVACSDATSLPEVVGDAALMFDPLDVDAIAQAVGSLLDDDELRHWLVARGLERPRQFTWERCAEAAWQSYERALAG
jgi:glycosyltransferase involved in cell wall biosynthesis